MSPSQEYEQRRKARSKRAEYHERLHIGIGNVRLLLAIAGVAVIWQAFGSHRVSLWWVLLPFFLFVALAYIHSRVLRAHQFALSAVAVYDRGLARIEDRWAGTGQTGERFNDPHHIYAADLDVFGKGSLFELLSMARTRMGEGTLANWLLSPAPLSIVRAREAAISELRDKLDLREDLAVLGENVAVGVHPEALIEWAEGPRVLTAVWPRAVAKMLAIFAVAAVAVWAIYGLVTPFVLVLLIEGVLVFRLRKSMESVTHRAEHAFEDLSLLADVLARLERENFDSPHLRTLAGELLSEGKQASTAIARLRTLVDRVESRHNLFIRLIDLPLMYTVQVAYAVETWRSRHGGAVRRWVSAVGEMEALLSLAAYSYEHPADTFPEFLDGAACFDGEDLGHPLIPAKNCVANTVRLCAETKVLLVSGSNMSGKSTLLRSVGVNTVLAMAGAPVRACKLKLTALQVGASIRVNDSLQEHSSRFYAEITRLRQIVDAAAGGLPLLFLVDELLQGTNSRDRRIGGEALIRELVRFGAIGLVTTHDLALTEVPEDIDRHMVNVHFQDYLENGKMHFDYRLRDGVVAKSNGLELMRSIGLQV
ncbi:MAG TPA: mismatch repair protein [Clostridia bacterium]|nr:mismatch repair protein [Clostridia bacterium]